MLSVVAVAVAMQEIAHKFCACQGGGHLMESIGSDHNVYQY